MGRLPFVGPTVGRAHRVGSLALVASTALALVAPGWAAATVDTPGKPTNVGIAIASTMYGATIAPVKVTWSKPAKGYPAAYWVRAMPEESGPMDDCFDPYPYYYCVLANGLQTGQRYLFSVYAANVNPDGSRVYGPPAQVEWIPITRPGKAQNPAARVLSYGGGGASVSVSWSPPVHDGGGAIDQYLVKAPYVPASCGTTGELSCTLNGLSPGSTTISIYAHNAAGWGQWLLWKYTVPAERTPTPAPVKPAPTPTPAQAGRPTAGSSLTPTTEASLASAAPAVLSQTSSLAASAASMASLDPNSDRPTNPNSSGSTNPNSSGSTGAGGPPWWLLALIGAGSIGLIIVAALLGRRHLRPSSAR